MDGMSELLFGRISGPLEAAVTVFSLVGVLTLCVGLALLARRHEAGWWLLSFQKYPLTAARLRGITLRRFRGSDLLAPLAVAVIFAVATMLPFLSWHASSTLILGPGTDLMAFFVSAVLLGLLPAGLLGLAHRSRWAWFLIVISTLVSIVGAVLAVLLAAPVPCGACRQWLGADFPVHRRRGPSHLRLGSVEKRPGAEVFAFLSHVKAAARRSSISMTVYTNQSHRPGKVFTLAAATSCQES